MYKGILQTHLITVILFLVIYVIKTILLLANKNEGLQKFTKSFKVPEMIISTLFLGTGIYLFVNSGTLENFIYIKLCAVAISIPLAIVGFKKGNKAMAVISLVLLFMAYGLAEMHKGRVKKGTYHTVPASSNDSLNGAELYMQDCAACHGEKGNAGLSGATDISLSTLDKAQKMELVKQGKGLMPSFSGRLTDEQISALTDYVATLKK